MLKKRNAVAALVLALALVLVRADTSGAAAAKVSFAQQPTITVQTGQTFYLTVAVSDVADLYAWQFNAEHNATYLEFLRVVEGPMLRSDGASAYFVPPTTQPGKVLHPAASRLRPADTGVDGSGEIAYVLFRALKDTSGATSGTKVTLTSPMLVDRNALGIDRDLVNSGSCRVVISGAAPVFVQPPIEGLVENAYLPLVRR